MQVVESSLDNEGSIDILINNAVYGSYGSIGDVPIEEALT
jgi:short-subunit dehydrogenase